MRELIQSAPWILAVVLLAAPAPARADEFGALPDRLEPAGQSPQARPDFRDLLREAAPVGRAEAAEQPAPAQAPPEPAPAPGAPPVEAPRKAEQPIQRGLAAWYQHPGKTASGERYNPDGLTAAHRTLPLGARLRVVYEKTGKSVTVRVTDRISRKALQRRKLAIELSRGGAKAIGLKDVGRVAIYKIAD